MRAPDTDLPIVFDRVTVRAGAVTILDRIELRLEAGAPTVLIGPNGSGKTTLLRVAMGAAGRALDTLTGEGHLTSKLGEMQHRADLYDLVDYEGYNHFDTNVFNFQIER